MKEIKFIRFSHAATAPKRAMIDSAKYEFFSAERVTIKPKSVYAVSTDIGIQSTYAKLVRKIYSSSSPSMKDIDVGPGIIDSGF